MTFSGSHSFLLDKCILWYFPEFTSMLSLQQVLKPQTGFISLRDCRDLVLLFFFKLEINSIPIRKINLMNHSTWRLPS